MPLLYACLTDRQVALYCLTSSLPDARHCRRASFDKFLKEDIVYLDGFAACYHLSLHHAREESEDVIQDLQDLLESVKAEQSRQQADLQVHS